MVQRSPNQQQHHNNNHTRKFGQNTKTLKLAKVGLAKVGQDHVGQSRFGQSRNSQSPSSLDFLHFQHLCCVHHMEAPAGMICSSPQSFASSFSVPCCRQRIHFECLARSVPFLRRLPFLHTGLRPHHLLAAFEHLDIPIDFNAPPVNSLYSLVSLNVPLPFSPLCCADICGPPDWMEWSPIHPSAQGSSSAWVLQWVCRSCESTSMHDIPALPTVSCGCVVLRFLAKFPTRLA